MRRLNPTIALVTVVAFTNAGCVAMMREPTQELKVHSNPSDANVQIDGFNAGRTPLRTVVQRSNHVIRVEKEGYEPAQQMIGTRVSGAAIGWTIAGVLLWGGFRCDPPSLQAVLAFLRLGGVENTDVSDRGGLNGYEINIM